MNQYEIAIPAAWKSLDKGLNAIDMHDHHNSWPNLLYNEAPFKPKFFPLTIREEIIQQIYRRCGISSDDFFTVGNHQFQSIITVKFSSRGQ